MYLSFIKELRALYWEHLLIPKQLSKQPVICHLKAVAGLSHHSVLLTIKSK